MQFNLTIAILPAILYLYLKLLAGPKLYMDLQEHHEISKFISMQK